MKTSFAEELITTFLATALTFAAVQIALPDNQQKADSYPVTCNAAKCSGTIPPVSWETKRKYQSKQEVEDERQAELEEMAIIQAEEMAIREAEESK